MVLDLMNLPFKILVHKDSILSLEVVSQCINYYRFKNKGFEPTHLFMSSEIFKDFLWGLDMSQMSHTFKKPFIFMGVQICSSGELDDREIVITKKYD